MAERAQQKPARTTSKKIYSIRIRSQGSQDQTDSDGDSSPRPVRAGAGRVGTPPVTAVVMPVRVTSSPPKSSPETPTAEEMKQKFSKVNFGTKNPSLDVFAKCFEDFKQECKQYGERQSSKELPNVDPKKQHVTKPKLVRSDDAAQDKIPTEKCECGKDISGKTTDDVFSSVFDDFHTLSLNDLSDRFHEAVGTFKGQSKTGQNYSKPREKVKTTHTIYHDEGDVGKEGDGHIREKRKQTKQKGGLSFDFDSHFKKDSLFSDSFFQKQDKRWQKLLSSRIGDFPRFSSPSSSSSSSSEDLTTELDNDLKINTIDADIPEHKPESKFQGCSGILYSHCVILRVISFHRFLCTCMKLSKLLTMGCLSMAWYSSMIVS